MRQRFILSGLLILFCAFMVLSQTGGTQTVGASEVGRASASAENSPANGVSQSAEVPAAESSLAESPPPESPSTEPPPAELPFIDSPSIDSPPAEPSSGRTQLSEASALQSDTASQTPMNLIRLNDIIFKPATYDEDFVPEASPNMDFDYLMNNIFLAQSEPGLRTGVLPSDVEAGKLLNADVSLNTASGGPKVLIFHTHSSEMYADSLPGDIMEGVAGAGKRLASLLSDKYGIETLHHTARYDIVDGASQISGAYERMEPDIRRVLADNPSVEMAIDLHRDGVGPGVAPMVAVANGKRAAKIMFVNGMCAEDVNGTVVPVPWLQNSYVFENLALSFQTQLAANETYPGFARRIYLKPYRYSLHMLPKSLIVEVGAQNNTKRESLNAVEALAEIIAKVVLKK